MMRNCGFLNNNKKKFLREKKISSLFNSIEFKLIPLYKKLKKIATNSQHTGVCVCVYVYVTC